MEMVKRKKPWYGFNTYNRSIPWNIKSLDDDPANRLLYFSAHLIYPVNAVVIMIMCKYGIALLVRITPNPDARCPMPHVPRCSLMFPNTAIPGSLCIDAIVSNPLLLLLLLKHSNELIDSTPIAQLLYLLDCLVLPHTTVNILLDLIPDNLPP